MAIVNTTKCITIQTTHGQVYVNPDFTIERNVPIHDLIRLKDNATGEVYWFNLDNLVWIGPRTPAQ